jgi:hypothetical protein
MPHPNIKEELIVPLSLRLSHTKRIIPLFLSDLFSSHYYNFAKHRVSEEIPYFALERQMK